MAERTALSYGTIDMDYATTLSTVSPEDDGPVWMVNLMHYRDEAEYADGESGVSGREADDRYAPVDVLREIGARVVFVGDVVDQFLGTGPRWDRIGIVRYPTRRSFIEMQSRRDFRDKHVHKQAGMAATIVMGCLPAGTPEVPDRPSWDAVEHPPSSDDGVIYLMHVLRFAGDGGRAAMSAYEAQAAARAVPHGVVPVAWMDVEGTIVGDGRTWDQVRLNAFPSRRAMEAVMADRLRREAQAAHRDPAIEDTYTLALRPTFDRLAASLHPGPGAAG